MTGQQIAIDYRSTIDAAGEPVAFAFCRFARTGHQLGIVRLDLEHAGRIGYHAICDGSPRPAVATIDEAIRQLLVAHRQRRASRPPRSRARATSTTVNNATTKGSAPMTTKKTGTRINNVTLHVFGKVNLPVEYAGGSTAIARWRNVEAILYLGRDGRLHVDRRNYEGPAFDIQLSADQHAALLARFDELAKAHIFEEEYFEDVQPADGED